MRIYRNNDLRLMGAGEYIVKKVENSNNWKYPQPSERRWNEQRSIEVCRSIDEGIFLGICTLETADDGSLVEIIDGRERTAVLYEMYHPEVRTDKRLLMQIGKDEYDENEFVYVSPDYKPDRVFEFWISDVANTFALVTTFNDINSRQEKMFKHVKDRLNNFNKNFQSSTIGLSLITFANETLGDSKEIQRIRLRGRLNRT